MVSPQTNPNPEHTKTIGRGFIVPEESTVVRAPFQSPLHSNITWGSVIAGSVCAMTLLVFSSALAYACGVPAYSGGTYGWGAGIWSVISAAIAFLAGGMLAAYLSGCTDRRLLAVHGLASWLLAIPLIALIFTGGFSPSMSHQASIITSNVSQMSFAAGPAQPTWNTQTGAAWGVFISLLVGMLAALMGGSLVAPSERIER